MPDHGNGTGAPETHHDNPTHSALHNAVVGTQPTPVDTGRGTRTAGPTQLTSCLWSNPAQSRGLAMQFNMLGTSDTLNIPPPVAALLQAHTEHGDPTAQLVTTWLKAIGAARSARAVTLADARPNASREPFGKDRADNAYDLQGGNRE